MNQDALDRKLSVLKKFKPVDKALLGKLKAFIENASEIDLLNINPYEVASVQGGDPQSWITLFLQGTKIGLFNFDWNLLCPFCGGIVHNYQRILDLKKQDYHCVVCNQKQCVDLDDYIEVAFTLVPEIKSYNGNPLENYDSYRHYYFSSNHQWPEEFNKYYHEQSLLNYRQAAPGEDQTIDVDATPSSLYRISSPDHELMINITTAGDISETSQIIDAEVGPEGISPQEITVRPGKLSVRLANHLSDACGFMTMKIDVKKAMDIFSREQPRFKRYLRGKDLLNNQSFREIFRVEEQELDFQLKVSNLTLVFTDLKGSTELYERIGDIRAFSLVQKHFDELKSATVAHKGSIVKTIGDAVMASFTSPEDGVAAARDMMKRMKSLNESEHFAEEDISIKVGVHSGPAIAVTANNILDYFGQTVNTAARVQGLSGGGEIWMTREVLEVKGVREGLKKDGARCFKKTAYLKGISEPVPVYRCTGW